MLHHSTLLYSTVHPLRPTASGDSVVPHPSYILEHPICRRVPSESSFHTKIHESKSCRSPKVTRVLKLPESKVARFQNLSESKVARVQNLPESKSYLSSTVAQVQKLPKSKSYPSPKIARIQKLPESKSNPSSTVARVQKLPCSVQKLHKFNSCQSPKVG